MVLASRIGMAIAAIDGCLEAANPVFCLWLGRDQQAFESLDLWELVHPQDRDRCFQALDPVMKGFAELGQVLLRCQHLNGESIALHWTISRTCVANGERLLIHAFASPSGGAVEAAPLAPERLHALALNAIDAHVYVKDRQGRYLYANPAAMRALAPHAQQEAILGRRDAELLPHHWADPIVAFDEEVFRHGGPLCRVERLPLANGSERIFLSRKALCHLDGADDVLIGFSADVTSLVDADAQLALSEYQFRLLAENSADVIFLLNLDGSVRWVSSSLTPSLGWMPEDWIGRIGTDFLIHHGETSQYQANLGQLQRGEGSVLARDQAWSKDGRLHWIETHANPFYNSSNEIDGYIGHFRVIDDQVDVEHRLRQSELRHRLLADNILDVVWSLNLDGFFTYLSPSVERMKGFKPEELMAMPLEQTIAPDSYPLVADALRQARLDVAAGLPVRFQADLDEVCKDGSTVRVEVRAASVYDSDGKFLEFVGITRDITEQHQLREQLRLSEERYRLLAEHALDVIWTMEPNGQISYISPSIYGLRGITAEEAMLQSPEQIHPPDSLRKSQAYFQQLSADLAAGRPPQSFRGELEYYCRDGSTVWTDLIAMPLLDDSGRLKKIIGTSRDITKMKCYAQELAIANQRLLEMATTDSLTKIWNRRHLETLIHSAIVGSDRYGLPITLIICDIDFFKTVNDRFGHQVGDQVLVEFCRRIQACLREVDVFARWGGEEFMVLISPGDASAAAVLAEKLRKEIAATPFPGVGSITASFGVAERAAAESEADWFRRVDDALYAAKAGGRNRAYMADGTGAGPAG
ncbi:MAG: PAS domain S-box protein [Cyanobacteriota bacterium]